MYRLFLDVQLSPRDRGRIDAQSNILIGRQISLSTIMITSKSIPSLWHLLPILLHMPMHLTASLLMILVLPLTYCEIQGKVTYPLWALIYLLVKWRGRSRFISKFGNHVQWVQWIMSGGCWARCVDPLLHSPWANESSPYDGLQQEDTQVWSRISI